MLAVVLIVAGIVCSVVGSPSEAASNSTVVAASVLGATWIEPGSCPGGVEGSTVFPALRVSQSIATDDDCTIGFGSSNASSSLLVHQADQYGSVMFRHSHGPVDTSYGTSGKGWIPSGAGDVARTVAIQTDGKALVVGQSLSGDLRVARFQVDGQPDLSFGTNGVVQELESDGEGMRVVVDRDDTILVSGIDDRTGYRRQFVARFDPQGDLVPDFGTDGIAVVDHPMGLDRNYDMKLLDDGRILLAGDVCCYNFAAAMLHPDGTPDTGFGSSGRVNYKFPMDGAYVVDADSATAAAVNSAGRIALLGAVRWNYTHWRPAVMLLEPDGSLDTNFSGDGMYMFPGSISAQRSSVLLDDADRMTLQIGSTLRRFLPDGSMDPAFNGGSALTGLPDGEVTLDSLGRYVIAGGNRVARVLPDGTMDPSFNDTGSRLHGMSGFSARTNAESPDGRILMAGIWNDAGVSRYATVRLDSTTIAGYQPGIADYTPGSSTFGGCVRALDPAPGATFITGWTPAGTCTATNAAYWNAIPARAEDASRIATLDQIGTTGRVQLRFGMRTLPNQPSGQYLAPITFYVVAPAVA